MTVISNQVGISWQNWLEHRNQRALSSSFIWFQFQRFSQLNMALHRNQAFKWICCDVFTVVSGFGIVIYNNHINYTFWFFFVSVYLFSILQSLADRTERETETEKDRKKRIKWWRSGDRIIGMSVQIVVGVTFILRLCVVVVVVYFAWKYVFVAISWYLGLCRHYRHITLSKITYLIRVWMLKHICKINKTKIRNFFLSTSHHT